MADLAQAFLGGVEASQRRKQLQQQQSQANVASLLDFLKIVRPTPETALEGVRRQQIEQETGFFNTVLGLIGQSQQTTPSAEQIGQQQTALSQIPVLAGLVNAGGGEQGFVGTAPGAEFLPGYEPTTLGAAQPQLAQQTAQSTTANQAQAAQTMLQTLQKFGLLDTKKDAGLTSRLLSGEGRAIAPDVQQQLPDPKGLPEGASVTDSETNSVVAIIRNGRWEAP